MTQTILTMQNFIFAYIEKESPVLSVDELYIAEGETVALVGRNGSGKSTLLLSLAGLLQSRQGKRHSSVPQEKTAFVFQTPCLDKKLTVAENLVLFGKVWGLSKKTIDLTIAKLNATLQLDELLNRTVQTLSGGQQRRADLARALLVEPQVLFLDEPTVGLDLISQREFWSVLADARRMHPNLTIICASHHAAELKLFERIIFLNSGKISLDAAQNSLVHLLPEETLEVSTHTNADSFNKELQRLTQLRGSVVSHDKLLIHAANAAQILETLRGHDQLQSHLDSVLIRKTSLSDAVWQRMLQFAEETLVRAEEAPT